MPDNASRPVDVIMSNSPKAVDRRPPMPLIYRILDRHGHRKAIQCLFNHAKTIDTECVDVAELGREIERLKMAELVGNAIAMRYRMLEDALETIHRESTDGHSRRIALSVLAKEGGE